MALRCHIFTKLLTNFSILYPRHFTCFLRLKIWKKSLTLCAVWVEIDVNHSMFQSWIDLMTNQLINDFATKSDLLLTAYKRSGTKNDIDKDRFSFWAPAALLVFSSKGGGRTFIQEFVIIGWRWSGPAEALRAKRETCHRCRA